MKPPTETILRLLAAGLRSGDIDPSAVRELLPRVQNPGACKVEKAVRLRAKELTDELNLTGDGLRLRAQRYGETLTLYLYAEDNHVAARGIGQPFTGVKDMDAAAEKLIAAYLRALDAQT